MIQLETAHSPSTFLIRKGNGDQSAEQANNSTTYYQNFCTVHIMGKLNLEHHRKLHLLNGQEVQSTVYSYPTPVGHGQDLWSVPISRSRAEVRQPDLVLSVTEKKYYLSGKEKRQTQNRKINVSQLPNHMKCSHI